MDPNNSSHDGDVRNPNPTPSPQPQDPQQAAADLLRSKIHGIYEGGAPSAQPIQAEVTPQPTPHVQPIAQADTSPYHRTHNAHPLPKDEQWRQYHSAWQQYYQQYYHQYYAAQPRPAIQQTPAPTQAIGSASSAAQPAPAQPIHDLSQDEALYELRQTLLTKVKSRAGKIRKSRHFMPIVAACLVVVAFVFVQYNRTFIATVQAYVVPSSLDPQNIVIDPSATVAVSEEPRLIIPKINVDVPVIYDVGVDEFSQLRAMEKGVAHFGIPGANSRPGQVGNTVLSGHSSNDLFDPGEYKFIFAQLEKMKVGDTLYTHYEGVRYTYVITKKEVVKPNEVNKLIYPTDKPILTLITCTPLGTALERLLVTAEQVSPDPAEAAAAPRPQTGVEESFIPGNAPTFLERLFGL